MAIQSPSIDMTAGAAVPVVRSGGRGYWQQVGRRLRRDPVTLVCGGILLLIVLSALTAPWLGLADPYKTSMIRRLYPLGSPNFMLGTDELGRDMLSRLIYGGRLSLFMGVTPVVLALLIGGIAGHHRGLPGRPREHADHAHHGRVLRLPVGAAGDLAVGRDGRGRGEHAAGADPGLHPADLPRLGERDDAGARLRLRRCRARLAAQARSPSCASMCWATCWGRSWSMPPR